MEPISTKRTRTMNGMNLNGEFMIAAHAINHARPVKVVKITSVQRVRDVPTPPLLSSQPLAQTLVYVDVLSLVNTIMNSRTAALTARAAVKRAVTVTPVTPATRQRDTLRIWNSASSISISMVSNVCVKYGKASTWIQAQICALHVTEVA